MKFILYIILLFSLNELLLILVIFKLNHKNNVLDKFHHQNVTMNGNSNT
jgi:hypothetical protein